LRTRHIRNRERGSAADLSDLTIVAGHTGAASLTVGGEVDASNCARLHTAIVAAAREGKATVEVDLAAVVFMDSTGVRAITDAARELKPSGLGLVLLHVPRHVRRILRIIDSGRSIEVRDDGI
jgi:anti-anti-sigma factor